MKIIPKNEAIKILRVSNLMTLKELSEKIDLSISSLWLAENKKAPLSKKTFTKLIKFYNIEKEKIITEIY